MKKNYFVTILLIMGMMLFSSRGTAQSAARSDSRVAAVFIMENILFKGIAATSEAELLNKKIQRVEEEIADPVSRMSDASAEASRKTALVQLKTRLVAQRNKLNANSSK